MRNILLLSVASIVFAGAGWAGEPTTLENVAAKGVVMKISGLELNVTYTPDGKFTAMNGAVTGAYRIDGEQMCSKSSVEPKEVCIVYPAGKKPGDEFELVGPQGPFTIKINQ
jgi:hypothetical protein